MVTLESLVKQIAQLEAESSRLKQQLSEVSDKIKYNKARLAELGYPTLSAAEKFVNSELQRLLELESNLRHLLDKWKKNHANLI